MIRKLIALLLCLVPSLALAQVSDDGKPVKVVTSADITGVTRFDSDTVYNLSGFVYVESGEKLIIEAGTIIKSNPGSGAAATALIVARGGKIFALGTACAPIIFTSISDDLDNPNDIPLPPSTLGRGLWGGLILLGKASIADPAGENDIEGLPIGDPRNLYGGADDNDNSGVLAYVSVRHGGSIIGAANEINGITFGGVGRGTSVSYCEVFQNVDDAFEMFGGTVNVHHMVGAFGGDDQLDYDEGYRGSVQFFFAIADSLDSDTYGEHDGAVAPETQTPFATPLISNVTAIGPAFFSNTPTATNGRGMHIRDNAGCGMFNSIVSYMKNRAVTVDNDSARGRLSVGDVKFESNLFWKCGTSGNGFFNPAEPWTRDSIFAINANDTTLDPLFAGVSYSPTGTLDPRPQAGSPALAGWVDPVANYNPPANPGLPRGGFFQTVSYRGAFHPTDPLWTCGWTYLSWRGFTPSCDALAACDCVTDDGKPVKVVVSADIVGGVYFSPDTVYNLAGFVYVESGDTLVIGPGTIIKSNPGSGAAATALIVSRGGLIYAMGNDCCPIVMTSISDDVDNPTDIPLPPSTLGRGLWGGLLLLGKASIADPAGENDIEGLPIGDPRNLYGGVDDNDNSGVVTYVSVRHGGSIIGAANEINGITFGGVGRGTQIDHCEVFQNVDDAFEMFGGTVNVKYMIGAFGGDDQLDYDEGYRGSVQFFFAVADTLDSDTYGEHDGAVSPETQTPFATPLISNVTAIGPTGQNRVPTASNGRGIHLRDNAGAGYYNSIFAFMKTRAITVDNDGTRTRLSVGDIDFENNIFWAMNGGLYDPAQRYVADSLYAPGKKNDYVDPQLGWINYGPKDSLDPRPSPNGPAMGWIDPVANYNPPANPGLPRAGFFSTVNYKGAFDPSVSIDSSWAADWSFLWCRGYLGDCPRPVDTTCTCALTTDAGKPVKVITDANITGNVFFSKDTVYNLSGFVYVDSSEVLTIQAGTVIKSNPGSGAAATALIVARGGQLYSLGTQCEPVIFTSISDDVTNPTDIPLPPSTLGRGLWGGVILLGRATIADPAGENDIEGLPIGDPKNLYGSTLDNDISGVLRYVSVRHGGSIIGAANEINGITFGGVGRGTAVDHCEVFQNVDDAFEMFGGTVNVKYMVGAFGGDDQLDYDEGYRGGVQFFFAVADTLDSDTYGEHDGAVAPETQTPFATPLVSNVTAIGPAGQNNTPSATNGRGIHIRDNAGAGYFNSIITNMKNRGITVDNDGARERLSVQDVKFQNNLFWRCGLSGNGFYNPAETWVKDSIFSINQNDTLVDPILGCINYGPKDSLDPRPDPVGPAVTRGWIDPVAGYSTRLTNPALNWAGFFTPVTYMGAFDPTLGMEDAWTAKWSFIDCRGYLGNCRVSLSCCVGVTGNVDGVGNVDIADLTFLVDHLFINNPPVPCSDEANVDALGNVDIADLTFLVDHLFINNPPLPNCP